MDNQPPPPPPPPPLPPPPLPEGWTEERDPKTGKVYYANRGLIDSQWERPSDGLTVHDLVTRLEEAGKDLELNHKSFARIDLINGQVIEREATQLEITSLLAKLLEASVTEQTHNDKANFPIGCTVCGSGGGKTTMCALIEQWWKEDIKNAINNHITQMEMQIQKVENVKSVFATFNSTCNYSVSEKASFSVEASLGIRIVASRYGWSHSEVSAFLEDEDTRAYGQLLLKDCLKKVVPEREDEALIILVDEIMSLNDDNAINDILLILSNFQQETLRKGRKVFVLVTSLTSKPPASLTRKTQRKVTPISLPPISAPEVLKQAILLAKTLIEGGIQEKLRHHVISEFCSSGGLVKNMDTVVKFFENPNEVHTNTVLNKVNDNYHWASFILLQSVFELPLYSSSKTSVNEENTTTVEELIFNHRVVVAKTVKDTDSCLQVVLRVPTFILRSISEYRSSLTEFQQLHLRGIMTVLAENRQHDGSYAKIFELALMHVLCLRLSLPYENTTLASILSSTCGRTTGCKLLHTEISPANCEWVEVDELTKEEVKKVRSHGTMVYSKKSNEGAVEGFWYLMIGATPFLLFLQMKFWKYCAPADIKKWEKNIHDRAQKKFGLKQGFEYAPLFFSTSSTFEVDHRSLAMPKNATDHLLEPFGICPMMLYANERRQKKRKRKRKRKQKQKK